MADAIVEKLNADTIQTTELYSGNMIVTGKARFLNPISAGIENAEDINQKQTVNAYTNADYILLTNCSSLRKMSITSFVNQLITEVAGVISAQYNSAENTGY